jgi:hypothetical protein
MAAQTDDQKIAQVLSPKQWLGVMLAYLIIPMVLLVCGGDWGWWQAWVYSALVVVAGIGGRMWAEKRHPGLLAERQNYKNMPEVKSWDKVLAPLMSVSISFPLYIVAGLDHRFGWSPVFPVWLNFIGFIMIASGYALAVWALAENPFFSSVVRIQTDRGHVLRQRAIQDRAAPRLCRQYSATAGDCAGIKLAVDGDPGGGSAGHRGDSNGIGRPDAPGGAARVPGVCARGTLSIDSRDLLAPASIIVA